jgi:hypothetical protein
MPSPFIPRIKAFLSGIDEGLAREVGDRILNLESSLEIRDYLKEMIGGL